MRRWILLPVVMLMLTGCAGLTGTTNTRTTMTLDGTRVVEEFSDDAAYYAAVGNFLNTPCISKDPAICTMAGMMRVMALRDIHRGMNSNELAAKISGDIAGIVPYAAISAVAVRGIKSAGSVMVGEDANYAPVSAVGSGNNINAPILSPPTTTTTTGVIE